VALATAYGFADDPLITLSDDPTGATVTRVRALHIEQLRMAVDAVRVLAGLNTGAWDETAAVRGPIRAAHVQELRTRLNEALVELSLPLPAYTDAVLGVGVTGIKRAHIAELRAGATRGSGAAQGGGTGGAAHIQWLVTDHLGTPRIIADLSGSLSGIKRHDYLPFGEEVGAGTGGRTANQGYGQPNTLRERWATYERDDETGLDYAQARYYSSVQGRFTSPDEFTGGPDELFDFVDDAADNPTFYADIENPQSLNKYQYTYNNPLRYTDSTGHCPDGVAGAICRAAPVVLAIPGVREAATAGGAAAGAVVILAWAYDKIPGDGHLSGDGSCQGCQPMLLYKQKSGAEEQEAARQNLLNKNNSESDKQNSKSSTEPEPVTKKEAVKQAHKEVGKQTERGKGKFGSPMRGNSKKGYRLDPPNPRGQGREKTNRHVNWWDYTKGKKGKGGRKGYIPIKEKEEK